MWKRLNYEKQFIYQVFMQYTSNSCIVILYSFFRNMLNFIQILCIQKKENLFNENKTGKGIKHWLNDLSLKSHNEIASKGEKFAKKNMWKLNVAHVAGLAYSTLALGFFLPKLNIFITNMKNKKQNNENNVKTTSKFENFKNNVLSDNNKIYLNNLT